MVESSDSGCIHRFIETNGFKTCILCGYCEDSLVMDMVNFVPKEVIEKQHRTNRNNAKVRKMSPELVNALYRRKILKLTCECDKVQKRKDKLNGLLYLDPRIIEIKRRYKNLFDLTFQFLYNDLYSKRHTCTNYNGIIEAYCFYIKFHGCEVSVSSFKSKRVSNTRLSKFLRVVKYSIPDDIRRKMKEIYIDNLVSYSCQTLEVPFIMAKVKQLEKQVRVYLDSPPTRIGAVVYTILTSQYPEIKVTQVAISKSVHISTIALRKKLKKVPQWNMRRDKD